MTIIVNKTQLTEGPRRSIFHFYFESDGSAELDKYVLVDPATDFQDPTLDNTVQLTIVQAWYSLVWFDLLIQADALVPYPSWVFSRATDANYIDFRYFGGLKDRSGSEHSGKILASTANFAVQGSIGTLILEVQKD